MLVSHDRRCSRPWHLTRRIELADGRVVADAADLAPVNLAQPVTPG